MNRRNFIRLLIGATFTPLISKSILAVPISTSNIKVFINSNPIIGYPIPHHIMFGTKVTSSTFQNIVCRLPDESDDDLRKRVLNKLKEN